MSRHEEDAAADDVGDDDGCPIEMDRADDRARGRGRDAHAAPCRRPSLRDQLPLDGHLFDVRPLNRGVLRDQLDRGIDKNANSEACPRAARCLYTRAAIESSTSASFRARGEPFGSRRCPEEVVPPLRRWCR